MNPAANLPPKWEELTPEQQAAVLALLAQLVKQQLQAIQSPVTAEVNHEPTS